MSNVCVQKYCCKKFDCSENALHIWVIYKIFFCTEMESDLTSISSDVHFTYWCVLVQGIVGFGTFVDKSICYCFGRWRCLNYSLKEYWYNTSTQPGGRRGHFPPQKQRFCSEMLTSPQNKKKKIYSYEQKNFFYLKWVRENQIKCFGFLKR